MCQALSSTKTFESPYSILCNFIYEKGSVRKVNQKHVMGKLFVKMARYYNQFLQSQTIRGIEAYPDTIVESANESLLRKAIKPYNKLMMNELCVEPDVAMLSCCHTQHSLTALDKFLKVLASFDDDQYCWSMFRRFEERLFESYVSIQNENKSFFLPSRDYLKQFYKKFVQKLVSAEIQSANLKEAVEYCEERLSWWKNKFLKESILKYLNDLTFEDTVMQKTFAAHTDRFKEERKNCKFAETRQASADNVNPFVVANFAQRLLEVKQNCLKNVSTNVNASWNDPVQLLTPDNNNKLHLNQEAARKLEKIDKPFAVIGITGLYQSGKTKLFNGIAAKQSASVSVGTTETKGIWVWYIEYSSQGGNSGKGVLLLDTQGIGSQMGDTSFDNRILCLSALLSTVFIFNSPGEIDALVMEKFVKTLSRCVNHENSTESPPKFVLIVDDVVDKTTRESDVAKRLFSGYQKYPAVQNELIIDFTHCFPERQCFSLSLITTNFQQFFDHVVTNSSVKKINQTCDINGRRFVHLVQEYSKLLEVNALDERVQTVALNIARCENEIAFRDSMEFYHTLFIEKLLFDPKNLLDMSRLHREFSSCTIDMFLRNCVCNTDGVPGGKLLREMHDTYLNVLKNYHFSLSIPESQLFVEFCNKLPDSTRSGEKVLDLEDLGQLTNVESHSGVNCDNVNKVNGLQMQEWLTKLHNAIEERLQLQKTIDMNIEHLARIFALPTDSSGMNTNVFHQIYTQAQETAISGSWTEPIQLLKPEINCYLTIDQNAIDKLAAIDKPLVIITVAGIYRTGKSYLLNRIGRKRCFQSLSSGFKVTSSSQLETIGLWAWYIKHPSDASKGILLLDTHSLGDPETNDPDYDKRIMCLSAMLSSVLIFNFRGEVDVTTIEKLTFINDLYDLISEEKKSKLSAEFASPKFVLLVRDCQSEIEINGEEVTEDKYMEEKMFSCKDSYPKSHNELIDRFKNYFVDRKCFTLSMPANGKHIKNLNTLIDDNLDSGFVLEFDKLYDHLLQNAQVKQCKDVLDVNGKKFVDLLKTSLDLIQKNLESFTSATVADLAENENARMMQENIRIKQCKEHYDVLMKENSGLQPNLSAWLECHLICCTIIAKNFLDKNVTCDEELNLYKSLVECLHDSCAKYAKNHFATYFDKRLEQLFLSTQSGEEYFYQDSTFTYLYNSIVKFLSWLFPTDSSKVNITKLFATGSSKVNMTKLRQNYERKFQQFSDNLAKQQISRFLSDMSTLENTVQLINHVLVYLFMESHERWKIEIVKTDHNDCKQSNCIHQLESQMDEKIANFEKGLLHNSVSSKERKVLDRIFTDSEK